MIRLMKDGDTPRLRELWKKVFGDGDAYIDVFFRNLYRPGAGVVAEEGGEPRAMGFLVDIGRYRGAECLVTYAVACDPLFRNRGYGGEISRRLYEMSGPGGVICPAEESLFGFYSRRTEYKTEFFVTEKSFLRGGLPHPEGEIIPMVEEEYGVIRETLLAGRPHIEFNMNALRHQREICDLSGGDMMKLELPSGICCAAAECCGGVVTVKELLAPEGEIESAAALIMEKYGGERVTVRTPSVSSGKAHPFAMGKRGYSPGDPLPWYGFAFD